MGRVSWIFEREIKIKDENFSQWRIRSFINGLIVKHDENESLIKSYHFGVILSYGWDLIGLIVWGMNGNHQYRYLERFSVRYFANIVQVREPRTFGKEYGLHHHWYEIGYFKGGINDYNDWIDSVRWRVQKMELFDGEIRVSFG